MSPRFAISCLIFFGILHAPSVYAGEVQVSSNFDRRSVDVGGEVRLTVKVTGAQGGNIQAPRLPGFQGFDMFYTGRASHITFVDGETSSNVEFSYVLVARQKGRFTFPPIQISVGNQNYATAPFELEVVDGLDAGAPSGASPQPASGTSGYGVPPPPTRPQSSSQPAYVPPAAQPSAQQPPPDFQPEDDNIFVQAWVDKESVYPNEQVLLSFSLYTRYDTRYEGFEKEPQVSGFWIEEFPMEREIRRETVRVRGKRYVKADVKQTALFPTAPAEYTIDPGVIKVSIRQEPENSSVFDEFFNDSFFSGGGFFARRENRLLKPPLIKIQVKPFPETGKPAGFQGAVGNFRMSAALDKQSVKQNEPVIMKLVIEGEGNIETLNKPQLPELADFKTYDSDTSSQLFKTGHVIGGRKTFEVVYIPLKSGPLKIPALEFSYFDPQVQAYRTLKTQDFSLQVTPSDKPFKLPENLTGEETLKKEIRLEAKDIRFIDERVPDFAAAAIRGHLLKGLFAADAALTLAVLFGLVRARQESIYARNSGLKRRRFARAAADSRMKRLKNLSRKSEDAAAYFEEAEKILTQYLSDKFNTSAFGMTRFDLERQLERVLGPEDPLRGEVEEFFRLCDECRFARVQVPGDLKARAVRILKDTITRVEKIRL